MKEDELPLEREPPFEKDEPPLENEEPADEPELPDDCFCLI